MNLSLKNIDKIKPVNGLIVPEKEILMLPEKVIQFGTGVLLRGLPDYFIDKANRNGIFNGRIVVVKSTSTGATDAFDSQDGLYTLCVKGVENGNTVEERIINSSISRVLSAKGNWNEILACAGNPSIQLVISNTTEVGITLVDESIHDTPPNSFPAKLLAFLHARFNAFNGSMESGMVIIPTELITDNGSKLRSVLIELSRLNNLSKEFNDWLISANDFCDSLVDRIVPGRLPDTERIEEETMLGYSDELMIMSESFRLWAIQTSSERVKNILSFAAADDGVVIAPDIDKFRELKLRLLNGTHSFACGVAFLAGFPTVKSAMADENFSAFISSLMFHEIVPAISNESISKAEAETFAAKVIDRFSNPHLEHKWSGIAVQYSSKMRMRNVPLMKWYYGKTNEVPTYMSFGFAAYLLYMKCRLQGEHYTGDFSGSQYILVDDHANYFAGKWSDNDMERMVENVLADKKFWGEDLSDIKGLDSEIIENIRSIVHNGVHKSLESLRLNKINVG